MSTTTAITYNVKTAHGTIHSLTEGRTYRQRGYQTRNASHDGTNGAGKADCGTLTSSAAHVTTDAVTCPKCLAKYPAPVVVDDMPAGSHVTVTIDDDERRVTPGMPGVVVESFCPDMGRNVRLSDGRVVNMRKLDLSLTAETTRRAIETTREFVATTVREVYPVGRVITVDHGPRAGHVATIIGYDGAFIAVRYADGAEALLFAWEISHESDEALREAAHVEALAEYAHAAAVGHASMWAPGTRVGHAIGCVLADRHDGPCSKMTAADKRAAARKGVEIVAATMTAIEAAPAADRVPVVRQAGCEFCDRYGRACGRHESPTSDPADAYANWPAAAKAALATALDAGNKALAENARLHAQIADMNAAADTPQRRADDKLIVNALVDQAIKLRADARSRRYSGDAYAGIRADIRAEADRYDRIINTRFATTTARIIAGVKH